MCILKSKNKYKALTLLEMVIVCCMMSFALTGFVTMLNTARKTQYEADILSRMSLNANAELEKWCAKNYTDLHPGTFYINKTIDSFTTGTVSIAPFQDTEILEITVTVIRKTQKGKRKIVFSSLRGKEFQP
jgi:hypothetical protein